MTCEKHTISSKANMYNIDCQGELSKCKGICQYDYQGGDGIKINKQ